MVRHASYCSSQPFALGSGRTLRPVCIQISVAGKGLTKLNLYMPQVICNVFPRANHHRRSLPCATRLHVEERGAAAGIRAGTRLLREESHRPRLVHK